MVEMAGSEISRGAPRRSRRTGVFAMMLVVALHPGSAAALRGPDERAIEIARRSLDAIESGWGLARYDGARRVRAAVNLRGGGSPPVGITANIVIDRFARRYRLDAAGGVGPLTLYVDGANAALHVPGLNQYARGEAGALAPGATFSRSLTAEIAAMRTRLNDGYDGLIYRGEEKLDGTVTHRIDDTPGLSTIASFWIDGRTYLPRRIVLTREGRQDLRIDFRYGAGPRPSRVDARLVGQRDVQLAITPRYDGAGRVTHLHAVSRVASGEFTTDVNLDWSPRVSEGHFRFMPPAGAQEVPFGQLASGVMFAAAGTLGVFLPLFTGWS